MLDLINDLSNFSTIYTLYGAFILGVGLRYIWTWKLEYSFIDSTCTSSELNISASALIIQMKKRSMLHMLMNYIIRIVRRKDNLNSDSEEPFFSL